MTGQTMPDMREGTAAQAQEPISRTSNSANRFAEVALERHKREGMVLAVRARWIALAVIAVMLPFVDPEIEVIYYEAILLGFALIGWCQLRVARVGQSNTELFLVFCDYALMTVAIVVPNPLGPENWPLAMEYRNGTFVYFYILLASSTLAYSWRTVRGIGPAAGGLWLLALGVVWFMAEEHEALTEAAYAAFGPDRDLAALLDPNNLLLGIRIQEIVVLVITGTILAISVRRYRNLLMGHAALERERANLARYFSPNVVEELSQNDEPLKQIRVQNIAVLFVDIVGFTRFAANKAPQEVILTLREFHQRMETEVFRHDGTLDKYLGDGLMATFGTPVAGTSDALNALLCARAMMASIEAWNVERGSIGEPRIEACFGLHYGPVVLGDIGSSRLEFAVIGNTVNIASRVEALTRNLRVTLAVTDDLFNAASREAGENDQYTADLIRHDAQDIRGIDTKMTVWTLA